MDKQEYCWLFWNFSETTAEGTVLAKTTGKEVPVELDFPFFLINYFRSRILGREPVCEIPKRISILDIEWVEV